jgi:hypothetical protein
VHCLASLWLEAGKTTIDSRLCALSCIAKQE